ncbi:hypothetical protein VPNG_10215 [Cytospora leucostoma]|uniref:PCI domain-containing protein n=1 Tax=Cytospora leucostoma TaxID=1230097 RepID=A0A423VE69_9PEZI|nr:hypothetical protein VPNG_10215 [Cytospora leucostoma]
MEQTKALNALEPFLALTKSATSPRAAADLISRATSAPATYIFTELLASTQIQALASSSEYTPYLTHLQIFSHGLYSDYQSTSSLPALNDAQKLKLRQLSLLTLSRDKKNMTYPALQHHLDLTSPREVEDIVISAVYAGLLNAKLNPLRRVVQVSSVAPLRDVQPATVPSIVATLQQWSARCDATLAEIEESIAGIRKEAAKTANEKREWDRTFQAVVEAETRDPTDASGTGAGGSAGGGRGPGRRLGGGAAARTTRSSGGGSGGGGAPGAPVGSGSKRGMEKLTEGLDDHDEAMDLDDEGDTPGQKRASRRKL